MQEENLEMEASPEFIYAHRPVLPKQPLQSKRSKGSNKRRSFLLNDSRIESILNKKEKNIKASVRNQNEDQYQPPEDLNQSSVQLLSQEGGGYNMIFNTKTDNTGKEEK